MSSISPIVAKTVASEAKKKGVEMLDAPVSGGEPGAIEGTLAIMVGGNKSTFNECEEILRKMGSSITYVGEYGAGQTVKLANQIIVALNIAAVGEAFVLGKKAGVDLELLYKAIRGGLAGSAVLDAKAPMILNRNFKPGFRIRLHRKDLRNTLLTASELDIPLPLTSFVQQMITALINDGYADLDHSAIIRYIEKLNKIELK
jgi:2-hydroxy-3-oxopropionate reductase